ncbi:MAG TPA: methyltransferase domain-containing protein [Vicinamibacterales bacterium]|nr:methyltransferase domain-containing protein [Vicinamibacterales bacterium]
MPDTTTSISITFELALEPPRAFEVLVEELIAGLERLAIRFDAGPSGSVVERGIDVGRVIAWEPASRIALEWRPADWAPGEVTHLELRFAPIVSGTRVTCEHRDWGRLMGSTTEVAGWVAGEVLAPFVRAVAPAALGDWLTDRRARRPSGRESRATYADPLYHYPNFRVMLAELALTPEDFLLEVGCGGGALLKAALQSGCRAAAVDHSPDMVRLARAANREAIEAGRLEVLHATAERLPFADGSFTCAAMTGVLGFLADPARAFAEIRRVLQPGGRFVSLGSDAALRGTPAAPEPMASRLRFYEDAELEALARDAGFAQARVVRRDLAPFAREVGVPEEHLPLFEGDTTFLLARTHSRAVGSVGSGGIPGGAA